MLTRRYLVTVPTSFARRVVMDAFDSFRSTEHNPELLSHSYHNLFDVRSCLEHLMSSSSRRLFLCSLLFAVLSLLSSVAFAQGPPLRSIKYWLSMSRPESHLFEVKIEVELPDELKDKAVEFQMPKWSPGRYAVFDFAKNVQEFRAVGSICPPGVDCDHFLLPVRRLDDQTWSVPSGTSSLTVTYKIFANDLSGTFSQLDSRHANFNGGSIFTFVLDHKADPVKLTNHPPTRR